MNKDDPRLRILKEELTEQEFSEVVEALNKIEDESGKWQEIHLF